MFYVYILYSKKDGKLYIGFAGDWKARILQHNKGEVFATKNRRPLRLIYLEACLNKYDAIKREKYLKSGPGKKFLRNRLKNYFKSLWPRAR